MNRWIGVAFLATISACALAQNTQGQAVNTELSKPKETGKLFYEVYADAVSQKLTGFSTLQLLRAGYRYGQFDVHALVRNEQFDTKGTNLPFQFAARGTSAGLGVRYWMPGNKAWVTASYARGVSGFVQGKNDIRLGGAGYDAWQSDKYFTDVYADVFYVDLAKDTFGTLRFRPGYILSKTGGNMLWAYGIAHGFVSGKGKNGVENRVEGGVGLGYRLGSNISINAEYRLGYVFRGEINQKRYTNPTIFIAGFFN